METISKAAFARKCKVSKPAISKAVREKRIFLNENDQVVIGHPITKKYLKALAKRRNPSKPKPASVKPKAKSKSTPAKTNTRAKSKPPKTKSKKPKSTPTKTSTEEADPTVFDLEDEGKVPTFSLSELTEKTFRTFNREDLDKAKVFEQILKIRQDREAKRGELIDRKIVERTFAQIYSVDVNEIRVLEDRLTSAICGIFEVEDESKESIKIRKLINQETTRSLRHIKHRINKFLVDKKRAAA